MLLPAGVALRWVTFLLKIYRAEDIPQSMYGVNSALELSAIYMIRCVKITLQIGIGGFYRIFVHLFLKAFMNLFSFILAPLKAT